MQSGIESEKIQHYCEPANIWAKGALSWVDQQYLLNDEGVQNFIKNGYITVHPDLPDVHEEIYRENRSNI